MAKTVKIAGATYSDVPGVDLPLADNTGNARFTDTSDATATADKILSGYTAYGANGTKLTGTASSGGGGTDHDFIVTADIDPDTMAISNVSHSLAEIVAAKKANKDVRFDGIAEVEGVATIIFSLPLVNSQDIEFGGVHYYSVEFSTVYLDEDCANYITVRANNAEGPEAFEVLVSEVPNPVHHNVFLNSTGDGISHTSGNTQRFADVLLTSYHELASEALVFSNLDTLFMHKVQLSSNVSVPLMRFEGTRNHIKYTLDLLQYANEEDVPQGVYYEQIEVGDTIIYLAFSLDRRIDDIVYIKIDATANASSFSSLDIQIANVSIPDNLLELLGVLYRTRQTANVAVSVNLAVDLAGETTSLNMPVHLQAISFAPVFTAQYANAIYTGVSTSDSGAIFCSFDILSTEPSSGYYIELPDGTYLKVACVMLSASS